MAAYSRNVFFNMILSQRRKQRGKATSLKSHSFADWGRAGHRSNSTFPGTLLIKHLGAGGIRGNRSFDLTSLSRNFCDALKTRGGVVCALCQAGVPTVDISGANHTRPGSGSHRLLRGSEHAPFSASLWTATLRVPVTDPFQSSPGIYDHPVGVYHSRPRPGFSRNFPSLCFP